MTKEDMIRMAREAGWEYAYDDCGFEPLWRFAALIAASEREACVDIAEDEIKRVRPVYSPTADIILRRIRERGQS